jgi:hypothetical protein
MLAAVFPRLRLEHYSSLDVTHRRALAALAPSTWAGSVEYGRLLPGLILLGQQLAQSIELSFPGRAMVANPSLEGAKSRGRYAASPHSAQLLGVNQADLLKDLQVLRNRGERDAERLCESRNGDGSLDEPVEDRSARGIPQCVEQAIRVDRRFFHREYLSAARYSFFRTYALVRQLLGQANKEVTPACFDHLGPPWPLDISSLMGENQVRSCACVQKL